MAADILDRTLVNPQVVAPGVTFEWTHEGRIVLFRLTTIARDSLDAYAEHYIRAVGDASATQPFLAMVDFSHDEMSFTPYLRQKINEMEAAVPGDVPGKLALLMENTMRSQVFRLIMRAFEAPRMKKQFQRQIFLNEADAIKWLEQGLSK